MFLAYNEDGPELLNRVIKIALDKEGKETEAARALMQAFDEGGEEALWGAFSLD
ncbi:MAG: hypothetical protein AB8V23_03125 [Candidatus Midichloria sp.]|uniref:Uncharacterized protein n=1 Tax=Hyalomma marginatum TaxID=34627 RepID=A0A8S4BUK8_9ACAR|nr:hypothetical protein MHYMCMPASI_00476 [Hyalomma marginatum]CAG7592752.1 hypothetical protein MHYMCMPSP_00727 [Hyalomma marginatum]